MFFGHTKGRAVDHYDKVEDFSEYKKTFSRAYELARKVLCIPRYTVWHGYSAGSYAWTWTATFRDRLSRPIPGTNTRGLHNPASLMPTRESTPPVSSRIPLTGASAPLSIGLTARDWALLRHCPGSAVTALGCAKRLPSAHMQGVGHVGLSPNFPFHVVTLVARKDEGMQHTIFF